jgi:hypothetical protein
MLQMAFVLVPTSVVWQSKAPRMMPATSAASPTRRRLLSCETTHTHPGQSLGAADRLYEDVRALKLAFVNASKAVSEVVAEPFDPTHVTPAIATLLQTVWPKYVQRRAESGNEVMSAQGRGSAYDVGEPPPTLAELQTRAPYGEVVTTCRKFVKTMGRRTRGTCLWMENPIVRPRLHNVERSPAFHKVGPSTQVHDMCFCGIQTHARRRA